MQNERIASRERTVAPPRLHVLSHELATDAKGRIYERRLVDVFDGVDSVEVRRMRREGDYWESELLKHPEWRPPVPDPHQPGKLLIPDDNLAARWLYREWEPEADHGSMEVWAAMLFPTARALFPLQRVDDGGRVLPGGEIDERAQYLFSHMVDGIGLRSRAAVYEDALLGVAAGIKGDRLKGASLGCGAGVPNVDATERIEHAIGKAIDWDLYDIDTESLRFSEKLVQEASIARSTFDYGKRAEDGSLIGRRFTQAFAELAPESIDVVDALGLWEYLSSESAIAFAQKAYRLVKPGGSLIVSNMLPSRPQREFNQRAVGWPGLYLRSEDDLVDIVTAAGIDARHVTMTYTTDGVYVVMEIRRP